MREQVSKARGLQKSISSDRHSQYGTSCSQTKACKLCMLLNIISTLLQLCLDYWEYALLSTFLRKLPRHLGFTVKIPFVKAAQPLKIYESTLFASVPFALCSCNTREGLARGIVLDLCEIC